MGTKRRQQRPDDISSAITTEESLREATSEARGVLKDMIAERKALQALIDRIPQLTDQAVNDRLKAEVAKLADATEAAMRHAVARVNQTFDELAAVLLGEDKASKRAGKASLNELIQIRYGDREQVVRVQVPPLVSGCGHDHKTT